MKLANSFKVRSKMTRTCSQSTYDDSGNRNRETTVVPVVVRNH